MIKLILSKEAEEATKLYAIDMNKTRKELVSEWFQWAKEQAKNGYRPSDPEKSFMKFVKMKASEHYASEVAEGLINFCVKWGRFEKIEIKQSPSRSDPKSLVE